MLENLSGEVWFAVDFIAPISRHLNGVFEAQAAVDVATGRSVYDYVPHQGFSIL